MVQLPSRVKYTLAALEKFDHFMFSFTQSNQKMGGVFFPEHQVHFSTETPLTTNTNVLLP